MSRLTNLALFLRACEKTPLQWGKHDCCTFGADAVFVQTSRDPMSDFRGVYGTAEEAAAILEAAGGLRALVGSVMGPETPVKHAQRGYIVLYESGSGHGLGVCVGSKFAVVTETGLGYCNMRRALAAWRVS